jgi:calcium permeable stress-gated cation channel
LQTLLLSVSLRKLESSSTNCRTCLHCLAIAYSCIAPLVLGFAAAGLGLYYFSYRYNLFYVIQPKVDTNGEAYTLALQHLLTGVYIGELALIGFFSLRAANGPTVMMGILFIVTIIYNILTNRLISPLEKFLPADLVSAATNDETAPLLSSAEEGEASHVQQPSESAGAPSPVTKHLVDPIARFFDPHVFASYNYMKSWIRRGDYDDIAEEVVYAEEDLERAYLHPALTSQTPVIWMARDKMGASRNEIQEIEELGLKVSDEGAWLDERGRLQWGELEFERVPVWKRGVRY